MGKKFKKGYLDGTFDLFHTGHLKLLQSAFELCDSLVVGINSDDLVYSYKHRKPIIDENGRLEIVQNIKCVDKTFIRRERIKIPYCKKYGCDVVFIGDDWRGTETWNAFEKELSKEGISVIYMPYTKGISTTEIKQKIIDSVKDKSQN